MSVLEFSSEFYQLVLPSSGTVCSAGSFCNASGGLESMTAWFHIRGTSVGTETITIALYADEAMNVPVASSTRLLTDFEITSSGYNRVRFDFSGESLDPDLEYYIGISTTNYTRVGDTFFIGAILDWPEQINERKVPNQTSIRMALVVSK